MEDSRAAKSLIVLPEINPPKPQNHFSVDTTTTATARHNMNISKPVASSLRRVDFGFLSSEEIKLLSVKRIQCSTTFDNLLHPVPGGLYDPSLGAWGDSP